MSKFGKCPICKNGPDVLLFGGMCHYHYELAKLGKLTEVAKKCAARLNEHTKQLKAALKKSTPKKISDKEKERQKKFKPIRAKFIKEHPYCCMCGKKATEVHHGRGKVGKLLLDARWFKSMCADHHRWAELHPKEAKEKGVSFSRLEKID